MYALLLKAIYKTVTVVELIVAVTVLPSKISVLILEVIHDTIDVKCRWCRQKASTSKIKEKKYLYNNISKQLHQIRKLKNIQKSWNSQIFTM